MIRNEIFLCYTTRWRVIEKYYESKSVVYLWIKNLNHYLHSFKYPMTPNGGRESFPQLFSATTDWVTGLYINECVIYAIIAWKRKREKKTFIFIYFFYIFLLFFLHIFVGWWIWQLGIIGLLCVEFFTKKYLYIKKSKHTLNRHVMVNLIKLIHVA